MNKFLVRLSLAAAITMGGIALGSSANAQDQQNSQEPATTTPPQQQQPTSTAPDQAPSAAPEQQQQPNETQSNDMKGQDAKSFTGQVAKEKGRIVLKDPVTKMSYRLYDQEKAASYVGKQVKVTGKLDTSSNTIQVESIEPIS
jgi:hemolysin activation/secretion protein